MVEARNRRAELVMKITEMVGSSLMAKARQMSHLPQVNEMRVAIERMSDDLWRELCQAAAEPTVDRLRGTDDSIRAVLKSIRDAISDDPKKDWRESLSDAADCLEGIRCI